AGLCISICFSPGRPRTRLTLWGKSRKSTPTGRPTRPPGDRELTRHGVRTMRTSARWLCGAVLAATVGWVAGCGGAKAHRGAPARAPKKRPPHRARTPNPNPPPPPPPAWEMAVDRHRFPATPVAGELGGTAFAPEVTIEGNRLTFQTF